MEIPVNDPDGSVEPRQQEHRQHPRTKITVAVELELEKTSQPLRVKTADLSVGGLYIEMMFTLEVGTKLNVVLWINNVKVSTGGVVVTRDLQVGNGIKFKDMNHEDRERLKHYLASEAASKASKIRAKHQTRATLRDRVSSAESDNKPPRESGDE